MTTPAQIEANRRNALLSTGPTTPEGKAVSSANSATHRLSTVSLVDEGHVAEAERRRSRWLAEIRPGTLAGRYAVDRMAGSSLRMERCRDAVDALYVEEQARAQADWDHARRTEALGLARGLRKAPAEVAARLAETRQGAEVMADRWRLLARSLELGAWDDADREDALDLLGVEPGYRKPGQTPLDGPDGGSDAHQIAGVIAAELTRLEARIATILAPADALARGQAEAGWHVLRTKQAALLMRYEREATRQFTKAMWEAYRAPKHDGPPGVFVRGPYHGLTAPYPDPEVSPESPVFAEPAIDAAPPPAAPEPEPAAKPVPDPAIRPATASPSPAPSARDGERSPASPHALRPNRGPAHSDPAWRDRA